MRTHEILVQGSFTSFGRKTDQSHWTIAESADKPLDESYEVVGRQMTGRRLSRYLVQNDGQLIFLRNGIWTIFLRDLDFFEETFVVIRVGMVNGTQQRSQVCVVDRHVNRESRPYTPSVNWHWVMINQYTLLSSLFYVRLSQELLDMNSADLRFISPQPNTSRSRKTTDTGPVHRVVCPFTPSVRC